LNRILYVCHISIILFLQFKSLALKGMIMVRMDKIHKGIVCMAGITPMDWAIRITGSNLSVME